MVVPSILTSHNYKTQRQSKKTPKQKNTEPFYVIWLCDQSSSQPVSLLCNKQTQKTQTQKLEKIQKIVHCSCLINPSQASAPALQETNKNTKDTNTHKNKTQKKQTHTKNTFLCTVIVDQSSLQPVSLLCKKQTRTQKKHKRHKHKKQNKKNTNTHKKYQVFLCIVVT